ncbi:hypothetical protein F5878DRAFT_695169 [Lentinula raphanica]|uniref:EGF-like domain-containing protein n=1 Tax=Lentinula raphanica TaxID=153919 RepID=A0AA38UA80_9AGAR|nr:hypothetical protein F5878DRAFT_695169 [Lentinula raphanica]
MFLRLALFSTIHAVNAASSSTPTVVCVAGQCLEGMITRSWNDNLCLWSVLLLPGQYTTTTNLQLLHDLLTSSSASLSPSTGFNSSSVSFPLTVALEPGLAIYSNSLYGGSAGFSSLPTAPVCNSSTPLTAQSLALSSNIWAAIDVSSTNRVVFWDSVPDFSQLAVSGSLSLVDMQSSACEPARSSNGVCKASGTCSCAAGFTGASCESSESGFFGASCQACPSGCLDYDDGISGTGKCLELNVTNSPSTCNCLNGECGSNGQCSCNAGWTTADDGTACAKCASGFFLTSNGDCKICEIGCSSCADITGDCQTCKSGFTQDANDKTKCDAQPTTTSSGTVCPDGSFGSGSSCSPCSSSCQTCNGATSNDCIICASSSYAFNGSCITADSNGECDACDGLASNGQCVSTCPANTVAAYDEDLPQLPSRLRVLFWNRFQPVPVLPSRSTRTQSKTLSSCSGPSQCLPCSSSSQVLKRGSCVAANCNGTADVFTALGVCLSDLVSVPQTSGTSATPLPSITGLTQPTVVTQSSSTRLQWWEILLMALGCTSIFLAVVWCWRRARKQRAKRTQAFAQAKNLDQSTSW